MKNACNFKLKYDGPALAESAIDVSDLAPALMNLSDALSSLNSLLNKDDAKVALQVKAFDRGCFIVDFVLNQSILTQVGSLLTGVGVVGFCNAYTLMKCLVDVLYLKKWIAGRKVISTSTSEDGRCVTINVNGGSITVNLNTYNVWQHPKTNAACAKLVEPLNKEGIDTVSVDLGDREETFDKSDVEAIMAAPEEVKLTSSVSKCVVMIETAAFKDNAKWKVKIGEQLSVFVSISDCEFMAAIDRGEERFGKGDVLFVELETTQTLANGKIIVSYDIQKVLDHKTSAEQLSLF